MLNRLAILLFFYFGAFAQEDEDVRPLFSQVLQFRSTQGKEREVAEFLYKKCSREGFAMQVFMDKDSFMNFSASLYPLSTNKPNIILLCHLDVVPVPDSAQWKHPPYGGEFVNDTLWGRGTLDMKGIGIMQYYALKSFLKESKTKDLPNNVTLLFVSDEESGGIHGAKFIIDSHLKSLNPKLVIGEGGAGLKNFLPSKPEQWVFSISLAEKKSLWLRLSVKQEVAGHGSMRSNETANSILFEAIRRAEEKKPIIIFDKTTKRMFKELGKMNGGFKGFILRNINAFWLRPFRRKILSTEPLLLNEVTSSIQFTSIYNPPSPPNVVANEAVAYFDCRLLPGVRTRRFIRQLRRRLGNPKVKVEIVDQSPTAESSPDNENYDTIERALVKAYPEGKVLPVLFPATTDNSYFRSVGVPCYGVLPLELSEGLIKRVHGTNECVPVPVIYKGIEAYKIIIKEFIK
jgi:acetylornithine deacetylase/succinyl-diaminopimelate desuccinylase-like protein